MPICPLVNLMWADALKEKAMRKESVEKRLAVLKQAYERFDIAYNNNPMVSMTLLLWAAALKYHATLIDPANTVLVKELMDEARNKEGQASSLPATLCSRINVSE